MERSENKGFFHDVPKPDITIIICAYNEEEAIGSTLAELMICLPEQVEILVVNDGSTDDTENILKNLSNVYPFLRVVNHEKNKGLGASLFTGAVFAQGEYVLWMDGDRQHRSKDALKIIKRLRETKGELDYIIGVRGANSHEVLSRKPGKWILKVLADKFAGRPLGDFNSGLRAIKRKLYLSWTHLYPSGFSTATATSILLARRGCKGEEIPIVALKRKGRSTVNQLKDGIKAICLMVKIDAYLKNKGIKKKNP